MGLTPVKEGRKEGRLNRKSQTEAQFRESLGQIDAERGASVICWRSLVSPRKELVQSSDGNILGDQGSVCMC